LVVLVFMVIDWLDCSAAVSHDSIRGDSSPRASRAAANAWAPQAQLREGTGCIETEWIDKTWRQRLEEHAAADRKAGKAK
jgi:hypothetical protein